MVVRFVLCLGVYFLCCQQLMYIVIFSVFEKIAAYSAGMFF